MPAEPVTPPSLICPTTIAKFGCTASFAKTPVARDSVAAWALHEDGERHHA